ncbi:MAG: gamma-glutamyl-gamma-aminobutyrate hydrolase family protein [Candidatus Uhrbacteria bacterium]|nr:gamma-glutamyl-gamma-aminobutyrate hydrolase family protein [Patescibacteria group bacterium]MBU1906603.1 gamma-glutamyl-gamma-aminobutyrate hydrolase family protein [Patescibacteria group bacterium]
MAKPIIGITCSIDHEKHDLSFVRLEYIDAVVTAGGVPVLVTHTNKPELIARQLESVDAVVGIGGLDYHPEVYGQTKHPMSVLLPKRRQDYDLELFRVLMRQQIPALLICGSMQGVSVAHGGSLNQHLEKLAGDHDNRGDELAHKIRIESGSRLHDVLGSVKLMVNSDHHQAVVEPGEGLRIVARSHDGTVEAIEPEDRDHPLLAVQWHPERLPDLPSSRALFGWIIDEALKARPARSVASQSARISPFF